MSRPDFLELARAWLVRAQGHSRPEHEKSLAAELESAWELGIANAIEAVVIERDEWPPKTVTSDTLREVEAKLRTLTDKSHDPSAN